MGRPRKKYEINNVLDKLASVADMAELTNGQKWLGLARFEEFMEKTRI